MYPASASPDLRDGFEKAVELRELGWGSGWSMTHMANIYARLGRGEQALECLDLLCRSCLTNAFFTLHNDWRDMGLSLTLDAFSATQLDANMGLVSAMQEMLFFAGQDMIKLLPACPARFQRGSVRDLCGCQVKASFCWDLAGQKTAGVLRAQFDTCLTLIPPPFAPAMALGDAPRLLGPQRVILRSGEELPFCCTAKT